MVENTSNANNVTSTLKEDILLLVNEYIDTLDNPEDIYTNNGLFVDMLKTIYQDYIGDLLNNKDNTSANRYGDIGLLDRLFNIYTHLVYKYKANKKPLISEYSMFTGVSRDIIHDWYSCNRRELTPEYVRTVKNWYKECENALVNQGGVFEMFQLKACYNWNDQHVAQENTQQRIESDVLPVLSLHNSDIEPVQAITETVEDA